MTVHTHIVRYAPTLVIQNTMSRLDAIICGEQGVLEVLLESCTVCNHRFPERLDKCNQPFFLVLLRRATDIFEQLGAHTLKRATHFSCNIATSVVSSSQPSMSTSCSASCLLDGPALALSRCGHGSRYL